MTTVIHKSTDPTPAKGELVLLPSGVVRTQQVTLIAIVTASFVCGGFLVSIKRDVADVSDRQRASTAWMFEAIKAISPSTAATLPPPTVFIPPDKKD